jgi:ribosomal protein S18 acetylase RimI-like enzyme
MFLVRQCANELEKENINQWDPKNPDIEQFKKSIESENLFIYKLRGVPVATISLLGNENDNGGIKQKIIYIDKIAVHPNWQHKGIGKQILTFAEEHAYNKGYNLIMVRFPKNNNSALNFFQSAGFCVSHFSSEDNSDKDFILLEKKLQQVMV